MGYAIRNDCEYAGPDGSVSPFYTQDGKVLLVPKPDWLGDHPAVDENDHEVQVEVAKRGSIRAG